MAIPQNYGLGVLWAVAVLSASSSHAQVFTYRHGAENFQAVVSDDRLIVKERYQGISSVYGDLSCPLGGPVKGKFMDKVDPEVLGGPASPAQHSPAPKPSLAQESADTTEQRKALDKDPKKAAEKKKRERAKPPKGHRPVGAN